MTISTLSYHLSNSYVHNWLVSGPEVIQVPSLSSFPMYYLELAVMKYYFSPESGVTEEPVDIGPLTKTDGKPGPNLWRYYSCLEDHYIEFTTFSPQCAYMRSWAFALLDVPQDKNVEFTLTTNGPADFWLNDEHIHRQEHYSKQSPQSVTFPVSLKSGLNKLLFRIEIVAIRETPFVMALKIDGLSPEEGTIVIPTDIEKEFLQQRVEFEKIVNAAYLEKYVYGWLNGDVYDKNEPITVRFSKDLRVTRPLPLAFRLESLKADIFQEGNKPADASLEYELAKNYPLRNGPHQLELLPEATLYYVKKIQLQRHDPFFVVRTPYSNHIYSIIHERRHEALEDAAKRRGNSLYTEIAKMVLGQWEKIDKRVIKQSFDGISQRLEGSVVDLLGFIGVLLNFKRKPDFPKELRNDVESCVLHYRYWEDEPGDDIMDFGTESRQLLFHTCEILAGQAFQDKVFTNSNQDGRWHREKGERLAEHWLSERGVKGWEDWDSPVGFEEEIAALSLLIDFANSYSVNELASIMMDKILFTIALNSNQGLYGTTHSRSDTAGLLSSRLEATSGITRIMWGMGNFNEHLIGTVHLALLKKYDFPNILKNIASRPQDGLWDRERQGSSEAHREVNKATYKTNEYILSSAQDYKSFARGSHEHIWQATLGPDANVFVNHPACMSQDDAHQPNFWNGNATLPRVVQWGDVLIAQYVLPEDDWLGFTHAYFPTKAFDEYKIEGHWAFAKKDKGYLALYAEQGFELVTSGQSAYRELRSYGRQNTWFCHMGQELLDGTFENFQQKVLALDLSIDALTVHFHNLRGDEIALSPEPRLMVNGEEQILSGFRHYECPYCVAEYATNQMDIIYQGEGLRLNFEL